MKDLIDLANAVFDSLVKNHGEQQDGRELFLYSITMDQRFHSLGTDKSSSVNGAGVTKNFEDPEIDVLDKQWKSQIQAHKERIAREITKRMQPSHQPKDGDIFNFWSGEGNWKEIKM